MLTEEVEQARNMLQRLQDGLAYDDVQQLTVCNMYHPFD